MINARFVDIDRCSRLGRIFLTSSNSAIVASAKVRNVADGDCVNSIDHELGKLAFAKALASVRFVEDIVGLAVDLGEVGVQKSICESYRLASSILCQYRRLALDSIATLTETKAH